MRPPAKSGIALSLWLDHNRPMLAKVCSAAVTGIQAYPVEVEVNAGYGDTTIVIVGLPDAAVKESRDRVVTALMNSGYGFTFGRTTINLAPADVKKEGSAYDLPVALGILTASGQLKSEVLDKFMVLGELALDGTLRPVHGALVIALEARAKGKRGILLPEENASEAAMVEGIEVYPMRNLRESIEFFAAHQIDVSDCARGINAGVRQNAHHISDTGQPFRSPQEPVACGKRT